MLEIDLNSLRKADDSNHEKDGGLSEIEQE